MVNFVLGFFCIVSILMLQQVRADSSSGRFVCAEKVNLDEAEFSFHVHPTHQGCAPGEKVLELKSDSKGIFYFLPATPESMSSASPLTQQAPVIPPEPKTTSPHTESTRANF